MEINIAKFVPPIYDDFVYSIFENKYDYYVVKGGRGGAKSSILSLIAMMTTSLGIGDVVVIRRHKNGLRDSCFTECQVAAERLGIYEDFSFTTSPLKITHKSSKCVIYFAGLDDPQKIKSLKSKNGFSLCWYEEAQQLQKPADVRTIEQTIARNDKHCNIVFTFNPPSNPEHWVNSELVEEAPNKYILHVNYTDIDPSWLGKQFINLANSLRLRNEVAFRNEFLGECVGSQGLVFSNIRVLDESVEFDKSYVLRGIDFGFAKDPCVYTASVYDENSNSLFIFYEFYKHDSSYKELAEAIKKENVYDFTVYADSADSGGIKQMHDYGCTGVQGCRKPKDARLVGIKFLQNLTAIYIDVEACPQVYKEFTNYSFVGNLPDTANDHSIDCVRYSLQEILFN